MARSPKTPADLARRLASSARDRPARGDDSWRRETFRLPREEARETARAWFERFPRAAYLTEIESWSVLDDGTVEFTMRRLPSAD